MHSLSRSISQLSPAQDPSRRRETFQHPEILFEHTGAIGETSCHPEPGSSGATAIANCAADCSCPHRRQSFPFRPRCPRKTTIRAPLPCVRHRAGGYRRKANGYWVVVGAQVTRGFPVGRYQLFKCGATSLVNQSLEGCLCFHPSRLRSGIQLSIKPDHPGVCCSRD